jgi:molybdopterin-guanine dinucleotide biosynthesis protein A
MNTTGIILAGGASRRMGCDKAKIEFGGRRVIDRVIDAVKPVCDELVIAGKGKSLPFPGVHEVIWVEDEPGTDGPLAGLASGLRAASGQSCVLVACDMPFLSSDLLRHLLEALRDGDDAVMPVAGGSSQPLHAVYSRTCLPTVEVLLRLGATSMRDLQPRLRVRYLDESSCLSVDPSGLSWFNMNDADDYRLAISHWDRPNSRTEVA